MKALLYCLFLFSTLSFVRSANIITGCPSMSVNGTSTHQEIMAALTHPCHYDPLVRPGAAHEGPIIITARIYIYHLQMTQTTNIQFKAQMLVQFRWLDTRLRFSHLLSDVSELVCQRPEILWIPHISLSTEHESNIMGATRKDQVISITPHGQVLFSYRLRSLLICQREEGNFPFDEQTCTLVMDNWRYNISYVVLQWDTRDSVLIAPTISTLSEFDLVGLNTDTSEDIDSTNQEFLSSSGLKKSSLVVSFCFSRKFGFYFWDYYVPSVLLVVTSWGTFWVDPEVIPARVWLATCTMLGFFGLGVMNDAMPKLSNLKINDLWFIGCNLFIFLSLAEFAFVNLVHRQETTHIPLKRASSKYIFKSSLRTERLTWKQNKAMSCPSSPELRQRRLSALTARQRHQKSVAFDLAIGELTADPKMRRHLSRRRQAFTGTHMTNVEMANWIDKRSRAVFPIAFIIFNVMFWSLMFI